MEAEIIQSISLSYAEGMFFDLWTIVHILSGATIGFLALFMCMSKTRAYVYSTISLVVYEVFEFIVNIHEVFINRVIDIFVGMFGVALVFSFFYNKKDIKLIVPFLATLSFLSILALMGWFAYEARAL